MSAPAPTQYGAAEFSRTAITPASAGATARLRAFLEIKTVWHPVGALSLSGGTSY